MNELERIATALGGGWRMEYTAPPPGVSVLREEYMARQEDLAELCSRDEAPVIPYIVAEVERGPTFVFGRALSVPRGCKTAVFRRRFRRGPQAASALVEYAVKVEGVPAFQLNPLVIQFAGLCHEYPIACLEPQEAVRRLEERQREEEGKGPMATAVPSNFLLNEVELLLRELAADPTFAHVLRGIAERPERLRECYADRR